MSHPPAHSILSVKRKAEDANAPTGSDKKQREDPQEENSQETKQQQQQQQQNTNETESQTETKEKQIKKTTVTVELDPEDYRCGICMDIFIDPRTTSCGHTFCRSCLRGALLTKDTCPICKTKIGRTMPMTDRRVQQILQAAHLSRSDEVEPRGTTCYAYSDLMRTGSSDRHSEMRTSDSQCVIHLFSFRSSILYY